MKNNQYLNKMWVAFVDIVAEEGYNFDDLIDSEGKTDLPISIGAIAYVLVKCNEMQTAIEVVHAGLSEKHFKVNNFFRIDNLAILVDKGTARKIDLKTARWLERSAYIFKVIDRIWTYTDLIDDIDGCADSIQCSNLWIVNAKETIFNFEKDGKSNEFHIISENPQRALVKSDFIEECQCIFNQGYKNGDHSILFIDSIINFNEYLEINDSIDDNILVAAHRLMNSENKILSITINE